VHDRLDGREPEFPRVFPGQWTGVSLPAGQQQVLDRIESDLEGCEPRLQSMFAIFTRLTRDDGAPLTESLRPEGGRRRWTWPDRGNTGALRAVVAIPIVLGLVALLVLAVLSSSAPRGCRATAGIHIQTCQSAGESQGRRR
jgi:hypothetical protein